MAEFDRNSEYFAESFAIRKQVTLFTLISIGQGFTRFFVANLFMLQLRWVFLSRMSHLRVFFCRECRDYALFGVEFYTEFWQKFSEILRILAEILRKKMAGGASASQHKLG